MKLYLQEINEIVNQELKTITNNGFIAIQTQDIRVDGYVEPLAKKIIDMLAHDNLWLKEIITVTKEGANAVNLNNQNSKDHLKIVHQYLLIYKTITGGR
jgi:hypothetical protein